MLFRRRKPLGRLARVKRAVWPRKGFARPFLYHAKCALRLGDSAHAIAIGIACGAFVSFTPLMGLHILLACALAWLLSGNLVAAALGTAVGNPFTFPAIWLVTHRAGTFMLGRAEGNEAHIERFGQKLWHADGSITDILIRMWEPLIFPMLVGGVPLGIAVGIGVYGIARSAVTTFQEARRKRAARAPRIAPNGSARA